MSLAYPRIRRHGSPLPDVIAAWNDDPHGGGWTGYDAIEAQMRAGCAMACGVAVLPATPEQYAAYNRLQNLAPELGYERRPPAPHGAACVHLHFEKAS